MDLMLGRSSWAFALLGVTLMAWVSAIALPNAAAESVIRPVAVVGVPTDQLPAGVGFRSFVESTSLTDFNAPAINAAGQTVFLANLEGPGVGPSNDGSIWTEGTSGLRLLAREGAQAPGAPEGTKFWSIRSGLPSIGDDGTIVFGAEVENADGERLSGVWTARDERVELLALEGSLLPADPNYRPEAVINDYRVNENGQIALWLRGANRLERRDPSSGIYLFDPDGSVTTVAETGRSAPGTGSDFRLIAQEDFSLSDSGRVAFSGIWSTSPAEVKRNAGLWLSGPNGLKLLAREGDAAPGIDGFFEGLSVETPFATQPAINSDGQVTFRASLLGTDVAFKEAIYTSQEGRLTRRALEFDDRLTRTVNLGDLLSPLSMNEAGDLAFIAGLTGEVTDATDTAILRARAVNSGEDQREEIVVRAGDPAPGTPAGGVFSSFSELPAGLGLMADGTVAFAARWRNDTTFEAGQGIWVEGHDGLLESVVQTGDMIRVAPMDRRIVSSLGFLPGNGNTNGSRSGLTDDGRLGFFARFEDGSEGIFYYGPTIIPEPGSGLLLAMIATATLTRRSPVAIG